MNPDITDEVEQGILDLINGELNGSAVTMSGAKQPSLTTQAKVRNYAVNIVGEIYQRGFEAGQESVDLTVAYMKGYMDGRDAAAKESGLDP